MTKNVRIENACNSNYNVIVEVYEGDKLYVKYALNNPTDITTQMITSTRHIVVRERREDEDKFYGELHLAAS